MHKFKSFGTSGVLICYINYLIGISPMYSFFNKWY